MANDWIEDAAKLAADAANERDWKTHDKIVAAAEARAKREGEEQRRKKK